MLDVVDVVPPSATGDGYRLCLQHLHSTHVAFVNILRLQANQSKRPEPVNLRSVQLPRLVSDRTLATLEVVGQGGWFWVISLGNCSRSKKSKIEYRF